MRSPDSLYRTTLRDYVDTHGVGTAHGMGVAIVFHNVSAETLSGDMLRGLFRS